MKQFFKYEFRKYQQDVLTSLNKYVEDGKVNIVAPPGSGKTILGLEIICRLNLKTIIFVPTLAIKEQWCNSYLINFDGKLKFYDDIRVVTYQSLNDENLEEIIKWSSTNSIMLVFDEAHHLYQTWLDKINNLKAKINTQFTLSLTATPPYDISDKEYAKYLELCGDIDIVIEVDKLIKEKAICPHQDYIYFNDLLDSEKKQVKEYKSKVLEAIRKVENSSELDDLYFHIKKNITNKTEESYQYVHYYRSIINYLKSLNYKFSKIELNLYLSNFKITDVTILDVENTFYYLVFIMKNENIKIILKSYGLIEKQSVNLQLNNNLEKQLNNSINKLSSIFEIVNFEMNLRPNDASILILTDFIRNEELSNLFLNRQFHSLSVLSIFDKISKNFSSVAVLSGKVAIVNKIHIAEFNKYNYKEYNDFIIIEDVSTEIVLKISELYNNSLIKILIGTKSLLGEGWDSRITNVLIFASFIESYVSSNQMRGRALRFIDNKVSHIWHLVSVPISIDIERDNFEVKRRFTTFYGLAYENDEISDNINRYTYLPKKITTDNIVSVNNKTLDYASDLNSIKESWLKVSNSNIGIRRSFSLNKTSFSNKKIYITTSAMTLLLIAMIYLINIILSKFNLEKVSEIIILVCSLLAVILTFLLVKMIIYVSQPINYLNKVLTALKNTLLFEHKIEDVQFTINKKSDKYQNRYEIVISSKYVRDRTLFYNSVSEILSNVDNPRYVLVYYFLFIPIYSNSLPCPTIIGKNKQSANKLREELSNNAKYKLFYTRNQNGLKILNKIKKYKFFKHCQ